MRMRKTQGPGSGAPKSTCNEDNTQASGSSVSPGEESGGGQPRVRRAGWKVEEKEDMLEPSSASLLCPSPDLILRPSEN